MMERISRKLEASERAFQQLADQTIKKDPVRALVELITNCDDSYKKLEKFSIPNDGKITIKYFRSRNSGRFIITDHAEGMSSEKMDECVGMYGAETHGFIAGEGGRSFFGRGLKEAILSMGQGFVDSIHNNLYHKSSLNIKKYEREIPIEVADYLKDKIEIPSHGTQVILIADRSGIVLPQFETLKRALELHYALRDIMQSPKREVTLIELKQIDLDKIEEKNRVKLSYVPPKGQRIILEKILLDKYNNAEVVLEVFKSDDVLTGREEVYLRQNGILVCSKGAIHESTLFKYEGEQIAQNLYGRLTCDYIDNLLRSNEPVIRDSRDGMDWSHEFNRTIRQFAEGELEKYITEEKKKLQNKEKPIGSEKIQRKFKKAVERLNSIAIAELKDISKGGFGQKEGPMLPPNGFDFIPNYYHILVGEKATLSLKINKSNYNEKRNKVSFISDNPNIQILTKELELKPQADESIIKLHSYIEGKQIGAEGKITAISDNLKAEAIVHVVAQKKEGSKRRKKKHRGMFREIRYSPSADPNMRVRYERETGTITIATMAPSVKLYMGPNGENLESSKTQVMTAELVTQAVCRELARLRIQSGQEPTLGEPEEALNVVYNRLISKYAHIIHSILSE